MNVVFQHILRSTDNWLVAERLLVIGAVCKVEHHHVYVRICTDDVQAVVIGCCNQIIVGVNELKEFSRGGFNAFVAGYAESSVGLTYVNNLVAILHQTVHGTDVRTVVDNQYLALFRF